MKLLRTIYTPSCYQKLIESNKLLPVLTGVPNHHFDYPTVHIAFLPVVVGGHYLQDK